MNPIYKKAKPTAMTAIGAIDATLNLGFRLVIFDIVPQSFSYLSLGISGIVNSLSTGGSQYESKHNWKPV